MIGVTNFLRAAGYSDAAVVEIITHVGMIFLTNILGKSSRARPGRGRERSAERNVRDVVAQSAPSLTG